MQERRRTTILTHSEYYFPLYQRLIESVRNFSTTTTFVEEKEIRNSRIGPIWRSLSDASKFRFDSAEGKDTFWHSSAHILGNALEEQFGGFLTIGPAHRSSQQVRILFIVRLNDSEVGSEGFGQIIFMRNEMEMKNIWKCTTRDLHIMYAVAHRMHYVVCNV